MVETIHVMSYLADGNFSQRIEGDYHGAFLQLKHNANNMAEAVSDIAHHIFGMPNSDDGVSRDTIIGIADVSNRNGHQSSSVEQTTASMEEISATVR